ncbi:DUF2964 family protein [Paraburkholderia silvatlantica]|uniref:DUF2964 family protein n=1 Tax=Paraburkholderia silvatlantica TaxID=321895 RepID=A0A2U1AGE3_9BURK|nr:DUF2964 family protein [Paraburkholderia silvatlantica]MBB2928883.1 hypothetical protein [Paraburkholderia silvatlantica]PVY35465.1 hypothetical protein C7411_105258 [Paraburkholderia silvatlantica]PXW41107.1 hypothetical protein C7413_103258 [Paraburkholderia silvatlantica]PYE27573.1 hypothetical protein C7410_102256 [Paraburkholderia silvatlantica]TDQ98066.1 hypothetical protein C7412_10641 [Paraburkholderia silvatlantica]
MVHGELRIVASVLATFVALFGLGYAIDGLIFDENNVVLSGMVTVALGIAAFVVMLTLHPKDLEDLDQHRHRES